MIIAKRVVFEGRVQGVGFRYTVKELSKGFDVTGTVKNLPEGSVQLEVMGEPAEIDEFIHEITEESTMAHNIQSTMAKEIESLKNVQGFTIAQ